MAEELNFDGFDTADRGTLDFNIEQLSDYLKTQIEGFSGIRHFYKFRGGQSNPTYLIDTSAGGYVMRAKPPGEHPRGAHAVDREYKIMHALGSTGVPTPRTYCLCEDKSVIGRDFYIMAYMQGRILWDPALPEASKSERGKIYEAMIGALAALHSVDYQTVGLSEFGKQGDYLRRQVERWGGHNIEESAQQFPLMKPVAVWLQENLPAESGCTLIHGDYKLENLILHPERGQVIGVIDWELSTLGDPLADLSYHCMPWHLPQQDFNGLSGLNLNDLGIPSEAEYIETYCRLTGRKQIENWNYYMVFNLFRRAAIVFGVVKRAQQGNASSEHAAKLIARIQPLLEKAAELAEC